MNESHCQCRWFIHWKLVLLRKCLSRQSIWKDLFRLSQTGLWHFSRRKNLFSLSIQVVCTMETGFLPGGNQSANYLFTWFIHRNQFSSSAPVGNRILVDCYGWEHWLNWLYQLSESLSSLQSCLVPPLKSKIAKKTHNL